MPRWDLHGYLHKLCGFHFGISLGGGKARWLVEELRLAGDDGYAAGADMGMGFFG